MSSLDDASPELYDNDKRPSAWVVFHHHAHCSSDGYGGGLAPVPPIPPMVLQMLNRASVDVTWSLVVNRSTGQIERYAEKYRDSSSILDLESLQRPNWWRSFTVCSAAELTWIAAVPFRLRRLLIHSNVPAEVFAGATFLGLRHVELFGTTTVRARDVLLALPRISSVTLTACATTDDELRAVAAKASALKAFSALGCKLVTTVSFLAASTSLTKLDLQASAVTSEGLAGLERVPTLTDIDLSFCASVSSVSCLAGSKSLVTLNLRFTSVTSEGLVGLACIPTLASLNLTKCALVTSMSCLAGSTSLTDVNLAASSIQAMGLVGLERVPTLTRVDLARCERLTAVSCLGQSKSLSVLDLSATPVTSAGIMGLECIPTLTKLIMSGCQSVTSVSCLASSTSLVDLGLLQSGVTSEGIAGLECIPTVTKLNLSTCRALTSAACLATSKSLKELSLSFSPVTPEGMVGLDRIPTLKTLFVPSSRRW